MLRLADLGVKRVIYSGKLGTLKSDYEPNRTIATGCCSILPNGDKISWDNYFSDTSCPIVHHGNHVTVPSVLQESTVWLRECAKTADYVDPEIGHMAYAALSSEIDFSYLHIVSDNLCVKYPHDLSNERVGAVVSNRAELLSAIRDEIKRVLSR